MTHLQELRLRRNAITEVPDVFSKLQKLRVLDLGENSLTAFPLPVCRCSMLEDVDLSENAIVTIPEVRALWAAAAPVLTPALGCDPLPRASCVYTRANTSPPPSPSPPQGISNLRNLRRLIMYGNQLFDVPHQLAACLRLEEVCVGGQSTAPRAALAPLSPQPVAATLTSPPPQPPPPPHTNAPACTAHTHAWLPRVARRVSRLPTSCTLRKQLGVAC
jgi:hypothetical protein